MSTKPDLVGESLRDLYEMGSSIEGLAEILEELDVSRELGDEMPCWHKPRHTAALIFAVKHLAGRAMDEIEGIQERRAGGES